MGNGKQPIFDNQFEDNKGLTKREYFAAMAMQGLSGRPDTSSWSAERTATVSVMYADALLKELDKPKSE